MQAWQEEVDVAVAVEVGERRPAVGVDLGPGLVESGRQHLGGDVVEVGPGGYGRATAFGAHPHQRPGIVHLAQVEHQVEAIFAHAAVGQPAEDPHRLLGFDAGLVVRPGAQLHLPGVHLGGENLFELGEVVVPGGTERLGVELGRRLEPVRDDDAALHPRRRVLAAGEVLATEVGEKAPGAVVSEVARLERRQHDLLRTACLGAVGLGRPELGGQGDTRGRLGVRAGGDESPEQENDGERRTEWCLEAHWTNTSTSPRRWARRS